MGFKCDFYGKLKRHEIESPQCVGLSVLEGSKVGIDCSVWMNRAIYSSNFGIEIAVGNAMLPKHSMKHYIWTYYDYAVKPFQDNGIEVVFVFDGLTVFDL